MKALFKNDSAVSGVVITLGSEIVAALLVWLGLSLFGSGVDGNLRWFAIAFVSPLLLLRHFSKRKDRPVTTKSIIIAFFVSFILYVFVLIKSGTLTF